MTSTESNQCFEVFVKACEGLGESKLVSLEECQYWLFELGYNAALKNQVNNLTEPAK